MLGPDEYETPATDWIANGEATAKNEKEPTMGLGEIVVSDGIDNGVTDWWFVEVSGRPFEAINGVQGGGSTGCCHRCVAHGRPRQIGRAALLPVQGEQPAVARGRPADQQPDSPWWLPHAVSKRAGCRSTRVDDRIP